MDLQIFIVPDPVTSRSLLLLREHMRFDSSKSVLPKRMTLRTLQAISCVLFSQHNIDPGKPAAEVSQK